MLCPLLSKCKAKVGVKKFREVCSNITEDAYEKCEEYAKLAGGAKTPLEWSELLSIV
jgi:hypothetical protein